MQALAGVMRGAADALGVGELVRGPRPLADDLAAFGVDCGGAGAAAAAGAAAGAAAAPGVSLPLHPGTFETAREEACQRSRFLLVYVHSPMHTDTPAFCRDALTSALVVTQVAANYIFWGASVLAPEGYQAACRLGATGFPFMAVVYCKTRSVYHVVMRMEGITSAETLARRLARCQEDAGALLVAQRADQHERDSRRRVQEEQAANLREAQRVDAEREARERAEEERRGREEREAREREEAEQRAADEAAGAERRRAAELEQRRAEAAARLPAEPEQGPATTTLRVTLISGAAFTRRFLRSDTVSVVRDFIVSQPEYDGREFNVSPSFPPKPLDLGATLESCGLCPRAVVIAREVLPT